MLSSLAVHIRRIGASERRASQQQSRGVYPLGHSRLQSKIAYTRLFAAICSESAANSRRGSSSQVFASAALRDAIKHDPASQRMTMRVMHRDFGNIMINTFRSGRRLQEQISASEIVDPQQHAFQIVPPNYRWDIVCCLPR